MNGLGEVNPPTTSKARAGHVLILESKEFHSVLNAAIESFWGTFGLGVQWFFAFNDIKLNRLV